MKKTNEIKSKKVNFMQIFLYVLALVLLLASLSAVLGGVWLQRRFAPGNGDNLQSLFVDRPMPPRFFAWHFSDRAARIGEIYPLEDEVLSGNGCETSVTYDELPEDLIHAFVAIEDKRFFVHHGVDWIRLGRAAMNFLRGDAHPFGASTLTQQLVKNVTGDDAVTLGRKLRELFTARALEEQMSKEEILEHYLNVINLAEGCFGVGTAARFYFDKDVSELTLVEDAALAAITQNPVRYDPIRHPEENRARRAVILGQMREQGMIGEMEREEALRSELDLRPRPARNRFTSWYTETVVSDVLRDLRNEYGLTQAEAERLLYHGGLKIEVAMDEKIQSVLERYFEDPTHFPTDADGNRAEAGVVVIDPKTGDLLGVVGAVGPKNGDRLQNHAIDTLRPAGSVIKPLAIYAPALEKGLITWGSVYDDVPIDFGAPDADNAEGRIWPQNATRTWQGLVDLPYAVAQSLNTVPVRILEELGTRASFDFLRDKLHLTHLTEADRNAAGLALGQQGRGLTLREVTAAYTVFPNRGAYSGARSYFRVLREDGEVLLSDLGQPEPVLSPGNAYIMTGLLAGVITDGTATDITLGARVACAGKTGTTSYGFDKWFVGYTPEVLAGVWVGMDYPAEMPNSVHAATGVWNDLMEEIYRTGDYSLRAFYKPAEVIAARYCADSGDLPGEMCHADPRGDRERMGFFIRGTEPHDVCTRHVRVEYDRDGGVANEFCPEDEKTIVGLIRVKRHFPRRIYITDAQFVYQDLPKGVVPATDENSPFFAPLYENGDDPGISLGIRQFNRICTCHDAQNGGMPIGPEEGQGNLWERFFPFRKKSRAG